MSFTNIKDYWELMVGAATTIGGLFGWWNIRKKNKETADAQLLERLEQFKKIIVLKTSNEVELSTTIAQKDKVIEGLKVQCPECYEAYIKYISE